MSKPFWMIVAALLLCIGSAAAGVWYGIDQGTWVMGALHTDHNRAQAMSTIRLSIKAIEKHDLEYSLARHRSDLHWALYELGGMQGPYPWNCYDVNRETMDMARKFVSQHPLQNATDPALVLELDEKLIESGLAACPNLKQ